MAQHVVRDRLNVVGVDVVAPVQPRVCAGAAVQRDGCARAGAVQRPLREIIAVDAGLARRQHQLHQVFLEVVAHVEFEHFAARVEDALLADSVTVAGRHRYAVQRFVARQRQDLFFGAGIRVVDADVHQEAVELCFRQRVGAFLFNRVLRRHHHEQLRQLVRGLADRYLTLGHGFEQRRLHLGRCAVDLIRQHQVVEQRTLLEHKAAVLWSVHIGAGEVGGQQVRRELDAMKIAFDAIAEYFHGLGLGQTGCAFDQQMAVAQQCDQQSVDQCFLADDVFTDVLM